MKNPYVPIFKPEYNQALLLTINSVRTATVVSSSVVITEAVYHGSLVQEVCPLPLDPYTATLIGIGVFGTTALCGLAGYKYFSKKAETPVVSNPNQHVVVEPAAAVAVDNDLNDGDNMDIVNEQPKRVHYRRTGSMADVLEEASKLQTKHGISPVDHRDKSPEKTKALKKRVEQLEGQVEVLKSKKDLSSSEKVLHSVNKEGSGIKKAKSHVSRVVNAKNKTSAEINQK